MTQWRGGFSLDDCTFKDTMVVPCPREIREYETAEGRVPFKEWLFTLRDVQARAKIIARLKRLSFGNFGDCRFVGAGVYELRIHFGPGYRVYFGEDKGVLIILLCGGDKSTQPRDIRKAQILWNDYRERQ